MKISKTLYVTSRSQWRSWLAKHHKSEPEIWLIYTEKIPANREFPTERW